MFSMLGHLTVYPPVEFLLIVTVLFLYVTESSPFNLYIFYVLFALKLGADGDSNPNKRYR